MEISGKVLREVEFRDRLRGYDTDEVDEFLEKVAVGIDDVRAELATLRERAERAERRVDTAPPAPVGDDDAIRRTLVLAQRTADLAISEAREEAARLVDEARTQSEASLSQAQEAARRMRDEADLEAAERLGRLSDQRDQLEHEIQSLTHLLQGERDRLSQALQSALRFVDETLAISDEMSAIANRSPGPATAPEGSNPSPPPPPPVGLQRPDEPGGASLSERSSPILPDVEAEISEDAATAFAGEPPPGTMRRREEPIVLHSDVEDEVDPDEALWARWAQGAGLGVVPDSDDSGSESPDRFPFDRHSGPSPA